MGRLMVLSSFFLLSMFFHVNYCASNFSSYSPGLSPKPCPPNERLVLLQLKHSFSTGPATNAEYCGDASYPKTDTWEEGADCCSWAGVSCDGSTGCVIGLDLSCSMLNGSIRSNSGLFNLSNLQNLNLAYNNFDSSPIPSKFGFLVKLTHLNLSWSYFSGEIPHEISYLSNLVSLDVSFNYELHVDSYDFLKLIHNLTELRVLDLSESNMSSVEPKSLLNISSTLRSLRLSDCSLNGGLPDEFSSFSLLKELDFSFNPGMTGNFPKFNQNSPLRSLDFSVTNLSGILPDSIGSLKSLEHLNLSECSLNGSIPADNLKQLKELDLSENQFVGQIPDVFGNLTKLSTLSLASNNFIGPLSFSVFNLTKLIFIDLSYNEIDGSFPNNVSGLSYLRNLDFSHNQLNHKIPSWLFTIPSLISLDLSNNKITGCFPIHPLQQPNSLQIVYLFNNEIHGPIQNPIFELANLRYLDLSFNNLSDIDNEWNSELSLRGRSSNVNFTLPNLERLYLSYNQLNGVIPYWLFTIPSLISLDLGNNKFTGCFPIPIHPLQQPNSLEAVYLTNNEIHGPIQNPIFELVSLTYLDLSFNNLSDIDIEWNKLQKLQNLSTLDLSHNSELSLRGRSGNVNFTLPNLLELYMSSCNISEFPYFLQTLENLTFLDLSNNKIHGKIPPKQGSGGWKNLESLDLSHNSLTGLEWHPWKKIGFLDLRSNSIEGPLVMPPRGTNVFMISKNRLGGQVSPSICICSSLWVLDLSDNRLNGAIPRCLGNFSSLETLDLQNNNFHGSIPDTFAHGSDLWYVNLNENQFERQIPRSLVNCSGLEILDLGNNKLNDTFPYWLGSTLLQLKVLILRSNNLHGVITIPKNTGVIFEELQILDVSHNQFNGILPMTFLGNLKSMMNVGRDHDSGPQYLEDSHDEYYEIGTVEVTMKGSEFSMPQTLTIFKYMDLSNNRFEGGIPEIVCKFKALKVLNFSHNNLIGHIPSSFENLTELESLDLSSNKLMGRIPQQLAALTSLEVLNLSYNQLVGPIPEGRQLSTFANDSYIGNSGLCGFPLSKKCYSEAPRQTPSASLHKEDDRLEFGSTNSHRSRDIDQQIEESSKAFRNEELVINDRRQKNHASTGDRDDRRSRPAKGKESCDVRNPVEVAVSGNIETANANFLKIGNSSNIKDLSLTRGHELTQSSDLAHETTQHIENLNIVADHFLNGHANWPPLSRNQLNDIDQVDQFINLSSTAPIYTQGTNFTRFHGTNGNGIRHIISNPKEIGEAEFPDKVGVQEDRRQGKKADYP